MVNQKTNYTSMLRLRVTDNSEAIASQLSEALMVKKSESDRLAYMLGLEMIAKSIRDNGEQNAELDITGKIIDLARDRNK